MGLINFIFCTIGKCFEIICLLSELNFLVVHSLIRFIVASITFLHNLPSLLTSSILECWNLTLVCLFTVAEGVSILTHNVAGGGQQLVGGVVESCKMVGYLASHVVLRTKDLLQRGLLSGQSVLRHVWEGFGIALTLLVYLANTIVNLLLIGTQNLYTVFVGLWETALCPLQNILELTFAVLSFLYSSLVGASVFLWTPCARTAETLASLGHVFTNVFLLNFYGLLFTVSVVVSAAIYWNPEVTRRCCHGLLRYLNSVPSLRRLHGALRRLYALERNLRQRLAWHGSRIRLGVMAMRTNTEDDTGRMAAGENGGGDTGGDRAAPLDQQRRAVADPTERNPAERTLPSSSTSRPLQTALPAGEGEREEGSGCGKGSPSPSCGADATLLSLLQEQEERKKCVICQDSAKTVVLLPCRHLCLCSQCTTILMSQPVYQRNCPLCRHMIFQTMDVYL